MTVTHTGVVRDRAEVPAASQPRVLLVEPDREVRAMLLCVFRLENMVATASVPEEVAALAAVASWKPSVVVLEPRLSRDGRSGAQVMRLMRALDATLTVIVYTSVLNPNPDRLRRQGAGAVVVKGAQDLPALLGHIRAAHERSVAAAPPIPARTAKLV